MAPRFIGLGAWEAGATATDGRWTVMDRHDHEYGDRITLRDIARKLNRLQEEQRRQYHDLIFRLKIIASRLPRSVGGFTFHVGDPYQPKEIKMPLEFDLHQGTAKDVTATPQYNNRPVSLDGPAEWTVLSGEMTLGPTLRDGVPLPADGLKAAIHFSGPNLGDTLFQIKGDARVGPEVVEIIDTVLVHGVVDEVNTFSLTVSDEYTIPTP